MSDDIVARLAAVGLVETKERPERTVRLCREAADTIERLRLNATPELWQAVVTAARQLRVAKSDFDAWAATIDHDETPDPRPPVEVVGPLNAAWGAMRRALDAFPPAPQKG